MDAGGWYNSIVERASFAGSHTPLSYIAVQPASHISLDQLLIPLIPLRKNSPLIS